MTRFDITFKPIGFKKRLFKQEPAESIMVTIYGDNYHISDRDSHGYSRLTIYRYAEDGGKNHVFVCNAFDVLYTRPQLIELDED